LWPRSYGSLIYNYLCNRWLSPLVLWVRLLPRTRCATLCDKVCQWLAAGRWFPPGPPVSFTNKTDSHHITEILLKVALKTIKPNQISCNASNRIKQKYYNMTMHYIDNMIRKQANKCLYQSVSVQSVPITTKVVSSNLVQGEVYSIQHYVITFVSDLR
jgi:hypothetical protein